jgi:hypothetical protein
MLKKVVRFLRECPIAKIKFPDEMKMSTFANQIQLQEPTVNDIIGLWTVCHFLLNAPMNVSSRMHTGIVGMTATQW